ncbi:class I SAM-dependent methyltransferase [Cellulosimicrobium cellulans]|uniref:class I SAM-dependent methyltransferase n=1 Tax=Cellulosimicrobium cellulans TaxID=1710 RepID=UPI000AC4E7BD|nr:class I SAM-dependent methyltransferase [Cellulosimicrobium cellulans]
MTTDPRTASHPLVRRAVAVLAVANARHPWNHNEHFHPWVLRRVPRGARAVLDVGCGAGVLLGRLLGRLGDTASAVDGIDADPRMVAAARSRLGDDPRVTVRQLAFEDLPADGRYDAVTMVAVLHHLDHHLGLGDALAHARDLLAPGGRLLVVGLARVDSPLDVAVDVVSALLNPLVGLVKHPRRARPGDLGPDAPGMPVRDPVLSVAEVARAARAVLPGVRVRRRLFFRYTLEWTRR